jgi:Resolvase, N terminal domain.
MSRNADDGIKLYMDLYDKGINLVFLKEQYINTEVYKESIQQTIDATGNEIADIYIEATNKVIKLLAEQQIRKAFEQSEKEVQDLHERTREGIREAKRKGKQVGRAAGTMVITKKSVEAKKLMQEYNRDFDGTLNDIDTMTQIRARVGTLSRNTYYKYKKELFEQIT